MLFLLFLLLTCFFSRMFMFFFKENSLKNNAKFSFLAYFVSLNDSFISINDDSFISIFYYFFPEFYLFIVIIFSLILNLSLKKYYDGADFVNFTIYFILIFLSFLFIILVYQLDISATFFNGNFYIDSFVTFSKIFILLCVFFIFLISLDYFKYEKFQITEYAILVLLAVFGMFLLISSNDFISLYLSLELQSFCLYILASLKRYSNLSIEAALKYFILGSFSSGIFLFGISLIYGLFGTTNFFEINLLTSSFDIFINYSSLVLISVLFVSVGILFKLAIFPFHFWIADVYEGSPMVVTAFFAIVPKLSFLVIFVKIYLFVFLKMFIFFSQVFFPLGLMSIIIGIFLSLYATKIKRLLAYSAITHMGYLVIALSLCSLSGLNSFLIYIITYVLSSIGIFSILLSFRRNPSFHKIRNITDLSSMLRSNPLLSLIFSLLLLSSAGIPPLAGFFGKFFVFQSLMESDAYLLAGTVILLSVVSAIYYIRLIRFIFFNNPEINAIFFSTKISWISSFVIVLIFYLNIFFLFFQGPLLIFINTLSLDFWTYGLISLCN